MKKLLLLLSLVAASVMQGQECVSHGRVELGCYEVQHSIVKDELDCSLACRITIDERDGTYKQQFSYHFPVHFLTLKVGPGIGSIVEKNERSVVNVMVSTDDVGERIFPAILYNNIFSPKRKKYELCEINDVLKVAREQVEAPYDLAGGVRIWELFLFYKDLLNIKGYEKARFKPCFSLADACSLMEMNNSEVDKLGCLYFKTGLRSELLQASIEGTPEGLTARDFLMKFRCAHRRAIQLAGAEQDPNVPPTYEQSNFREKIVREFGEMGIAERDLPKGPNGEAYDPIIVDFSRGDDSDTEND